MTWRIWKIWHGQRGLMDVAYVVRRSCRLSKQPRTKRNRSIPASGLKFWRIAKLDRCALHLSQVAFRQICQRLSSLRSDGTIQLREVTSQAALSRGRAVVIGFACAMFGPASGLRSHLLMRSLAPPTHLLAAVALCWSCCRKERRQIICRLIDSRE